MVDRIESLEDKIISVATENKKEAESKAEPQESQSVSQADKKMVDTVAVPQNMQAVANGIPVYYQIPVVDGSGNVVQRLPIERSVRKSSNSGVASLFARLSFKKKSRADIVKLVASGDLVPAQLVQIKSAIEKGLTETQLIELITNNISAEKMKEIIAEQLGVEEDEITQDTSFKEDLGADSLDLFELTMALEEEYDTEIPAEELEDIETVGDVIEYLREKGIDE